MPLGSAAPMASADPYPRERPHDIILEKALRIPTIPVGSEKPELITFLGGEMRKHYARAHMFLRAAEFTKHSSSTFMGNMNHNDMDVQTEQSTITKRAKTKPRHHRVQCAETTKPTVVDTKGTKRRSED